MKDSFTYPVVFDTNEEGFINIIFPDFDDDMTSVEEGDDPVFEAQSWLAANLCEMIDEGQAVPEPSKAGNIALEENQTLVFVNVWLPYHRSREKVVYVKKTLTIPAYLDILAKEADINFSETLADALRLKLGIEQK